ncbi:MAG: YbaK/EbsC family protein [Candidatus Diapherotrites archaeon]
MLEEFIEVNKLKAKIFPSDERNQNLPLVKSIVLVDSNEEPLLVILLSEDKIDFGKIKKVLKVKDVKLADPKQVFEMTGYKVGGVPPISIYGIKTIIDKKVVKLKEIVCGGGTPENLMQISVKEIMENVEEIITEDISK